MRKKMVHHRALAWNLEAAEEEEVAKHFVRFVCGLVGLFEVCLDNRASCQIERDRMPRRRRLFILLASLSCALVVLSLYS